MRHHPCYSSLSTYKRCPAAWAIGYRDEDPGVSVEAMENGKDAHDGIRRYGEECFAQKRTVDGEAGLRIAASYDEPTRSMLERFFADWRWDWGSTIVRDVAPVEQHLKATLENGMVFSGHIDLLQRYEGEGSVELDPFGDADSPEGDDSKWIVTDFKSHVYGDFDPVDAPWQHQLYCALAQANYPAAQVFEARIHIIDRYGWTPGPWRLGGDLSYILHEVSCLCDRIAADTECEPKPGAACIGCTYAAACPCRDAGTLEEICGDTGEGRLRKMLFHKALVEVYHKLLKAEGQKNGPIRADGKKFEGRADKLLVAKSPTTLEQDLHPFDLVPADLTSGITKGQIERAAKRMDDASRIDFLDLWDEKRGSVKWAAYNDTPGDDAPEE